MTLTYFKLTSLIYKDSRNDMEPCLVSFPLNQEKEGTFSWHAFPRHIFPHTSFYILVPTHSSNHPLCEIINFHCPRLSFLPSMFNNLQLYKLNFSYLSLFLYHLISQRIVCSLLPSLRFTSLLNLL